MARPVIIHYHMFKNAGTSLDASLKGVLGPRWVAYERDARIPGSELTAFALKHPEVVAISSHNAWLPPPMIPGVHVIPVMFVRHPLDRIRSVFDFETVHYAGTPGASVAKGMDIRAYVDWRLAHMSGTDRTIRDFQTMRLAAAGQGETELDKALDAVDRLPFVGLVEEFGRSSNGSKTLLAPHLPEAHLRLMHLNVTPRRNARLDSRLGQLEERLGPERFGRLTNVNQCDLQLWERVRDRYREG